MNRTLHGKASQAKKIPRDFILSYKPDQPLASVAHGYSDRSVLSIRTQTASPFFARCLIIAPGADLVHSHALSKLIPIMTAPSGKSRRLWFPISVFCLATVLIGIVSFKPELERNLKGWILAIIILLTLVLNLLWFLFLSRFRIRTRLITLLALIAGFFAVKGLTRVDGASSGIGFPRLAWKWTPLRSQHLDPAPLPLLAETNAAIPASTPTLTDVPQFFGPNRDGIYNGARLARDWKQTPPRELWRHPVGLGWAAFAVVAGRAYTQEQRGEEEAVTCYDVLSGKLLWIHANPVHFSEWQGGDGPRATPTIDRGQLFAIGATGILECLDPATGQRVWSRDVLKENNLGNLTWGISGSPLVFDETVIVTGGNANGPCLLAYRRATGEPIWKAGNDKSSYASPLLAILAGKRLVLSANAGSLTAHDPITGEVLLDYPWPDDKRPKASQPVAAGGDRLFLTAGYGVGCTLLEIKPGADGKLTAAQLWKNLRMKTQFNSAVLKDGYFYGLDDGLLACVEASTGERKWKGGHYGSGQTLLVNDLIIIQSEPGFAALAEARPDGFFELGRIPALGTKTWNYPTLAGRYLLVRNDQEAACYELPLEAESAAISN